MKHFSRKYLRNELQRRWGGPLAVFAMAAAAVMFVSGCESGTEPDAAVKTAYSWRVDTLRLNGTVSGAFIHRLWGHDRNSLYAVVDFSSRSGAILMRWDGRTFRPEPLDEGGGQSLPASVSEVWDVEGRGPSDIWVVGRSRNTTGFSTKDSSFMTHYDGTAWRTIDLDAAFGLFSVAVAGDGTVFAGGFSEDIILWKDGVEHAVPLPREILDTPHTSIVVADLCHASGILYGYGYMFLPDGLNMRYFQFHYAEGQMSRGEVFPGADHPGNGSRWAARGGSVYCASAHTVWRNAPDRSWTSVFSTDEMLTSVFGTTDENFWVLGNSYCTQAAHGVLYDHAPEFSLKDENRYKLGWTDGAMVLVVYNSLIRRGDVEEVIAIGE